VPRTTDSRIVGTHVIIIDAMILIVCVRRLANIMCSVDAVYAKFASSCSPGRAAGMQPQVTAHREQANKKRLAQETADHLECRRCVAWPTLTLPSVCAIYSVCGAPHAVLLCDRLLDENECALRRCRT
jgi:hypothetical protein